MAVTSTQKKLALVYGNLPTVEEIEQFQLVAQDYDVTVVASESICGYLTQTCRFQGLPCMALPDYDENPSYIPGLERALQGFDVVVVKERLGLYAFQAAKAKWRHRFRLLVWVDNGTPFPGEDVEQMRTIRQEVVNAADGFIVQSDLVAEALKLEGVEDLRLIRFAPFIQPRVERSPQVRAQALARLGLSDTDYVIGHIGQIEWEEGLLDLVHAMRQVSQWETSLGQRLKLVVCGIGSFATEFRNRVVQFGLDRHVTYMSPSREAFELFYSAVDAVYFAPTSSRDRLEAEPYRILGAAVHGIPVIAPRGPLVEETIGKHRIDFCKSDPSSLAQTIKKSSTAIGLRQDIATKAQKVCVKDQDKIRAEMVRELAKVFGRTMTVNPSALDHQVAEAESLVYSKQYLAAIDLIEPMFKVDEMPIHVRANLLRLVGDSFTKLGDGEAGKNAYMKSIELDPYAPKSYIGLGTVALTKQSYATAVPQFQKAVSLAPDDEMASLGLGLAFQGMGELSEASRWVVKALQLSPSNTAALFSLVQISHERGSYDDAIAALKVYHKVHPTDLNMMYTLAGIYHKVGDQTAALDFVQKILANDPYHERAKALKHQILQDPKRETFHG